MSSERKQYIDQIIRRAFKKINGNPSSLIKTCKQKNLDPRLFDRILYDTASGVAQN